MKLVGILLAAGQGRRFGSDKLVHTLADGQPMAVASASRLLPACDQVVAVWRPGGELLADRLAGIGCRTLCCPESAMGMGHSLAAAVRATPEADGWILALADMPFIDIETHIRVGQAMRDGADIVTVTYRGRRGHPVGFSSVHRDALSALTGDQGARGLIAASGSRVLKLDVFDAGVLQDIDTPEDLLAV